MSLTKLEELIPLSEAQAIVLGRLERGEKVVFIAPITRIWLNEKGLVASRRGEKRGTYVHELTDEGRTAIQIHRVYVSKIKVRA